MTDTNLVRRCRNGDSAAWRALVRNYTPMVFRLCHRMLRSREEAEDASQETFMRIHRSFHTYDPTRPLSPWIGRIAYTTSLKRLQARKIDTVEIEPERTLDPTSGPELDAASGESADLLNRAIDELSAQDRAMLAMRYREGLSVAEVGEATGIPVNTVKVRLFRARATLRKLLGPLLGEVTQ